MLKKLISAFKGLPPEVRMMLAMAGLGTPFGMIWLLKNYLFPNTPMIMLIFGVAGVMLLLAGIGWICAALFGARKKKRTQKLASDLTRQEGAGPVSMDVRAAIKGNNEKFFNAIRDMRKNLNVNVYDLPWYIIIGDSGCGKTKLINEGGLTFSTGKPEGYQLGTLNYNWWFTEDAIFVDMAGRLCNPQDDADHREWSAFLDTIGKGRKGYPINGAIVCVSAEHLLQDSPDKHEQDANTALERLRDLQTKLGVTFATYLVVTKCDKILGFMQFFDRAEKDISVRNQIIGWSKPGPYNELYDPESFKTDFDGVYTRLNELRIKRMNDDADEIELGLAYSFPEEFRELRDPLQTYMRTLFPMIKQARVVKNLVFRGVYFTTATQQGSVILKHLTERLGAEAAQNFQPLEALYSKPRAHFIKDLFFRKVFKEYGLVFRNEQEAARNRRLAKMFRIATVAICLLVATGLTFGIMRFNTLIEQPRKLVAAQIDNEGKPTPAEVIGSVSSPTAALDNCVKLGEHRESLEKNPWAARILSLGVGSTQPQIDLRTIEMGLFEESVLRDAIRHVETRLATMKLGRCNDGSETIRRRGKETSDRFFNALKEYLYLLSYIGAPEPPKLEQSRFENLFAILKTEDREDTKDVPKYFGDKFNQVLGRYITASGSTNTNLNPTRLLNPSDPEVVLAVTNAVKTYRDYWEPLAIMDASHPEPVIQEWMAIRESCVKSVAAYEKILELSPGQIKNRSELEEFSEAFLAQYGEFSSALKRCTGESFSEKSDRRGAKIELLSSAVARTQRQWMSLHESLEASYIRKDATPDPVIVAAINGFITNKVDTDDLKGGLNDQVLASLLAARLVDESKLQIDREEKNFKPAEVSPYVKEVVKEFEYVIKGDNNERDAPEDIRRVVLTADAQKVQGALEGIQAKLESMVRGGESAGGDSNTIKGWGQQIATLWNEIYDTSSKPQSEIQFDKYATQWKSQQLGEFLRIQQDLVGRGQLTRAIEGARSDFERVADSGVWGSAELMPDYEKSMSSSFGISVPEPAERQKEKSARSTKRRNDDDRAPKRGRIADFGGRRQRPRPSAAKPRVAARSGVDRKDARFIPNCATREFLVDTIGVAGDLRSLFGDEEGQIPKGYCLAEEGADPVGDLKEAIGRANKKYLTRYFESWSTAYRESKFGSLEPVQGARDWPEVQQKMGNLRTDIGEEFAGAVSELLENVAWSDFGWEMEGWEGWTEDRRELQSAQSDAFSGVKFLGKIQQMIGLDKDEPWRSVHDRLADGWNKFSKGIAKYPEIPNDQLAMGADPLPEISWTVVDSELAERLRDLKHVTTVISAADRCRDLADREVHRWLYSVQAGYRFAEKTLPYVSSKDTSSVDPHNFAKFIFNILQAQAYLKNLDKSLDGMGGERLRRQFYVSCEGWKDFIAPGDSDAYQKDLEITVSMNPDFKAGQRDNRPWINAANVQRWSSVGPSTSPANFYKYSEIRLGLRTDAPDTAVGTASDPTVLRMDLGQKVPDLSTKWAWPGQAASGLSYREATIIMAGKGINNTDYPEVSTEKLGVIGELFFPAFLERMCEPDPTRKIWAFGIRWDLEELFRAKNRDRDLKEISADDRIVGIKIDFILNRRVPEKIQCLPDKLPASMRPD